MNAVAAAAAEPSKVQVDARMAYRGKVRYDDDSDSDSASSSSSCFSDDEGVASHQSTHSCNFSEILSLCASIDRRLEVHETIGGSSFGEEWLAELETSFGRIMQI